MARNEPSDAIVLTVQELVVSNRPCIVTGVALSPAAVSCSVILYDNASTSTSPKLVVVGAAADSTATYHSDGGIVFNNGCVAVVAGTGAQATVVFAKI